MLAGFFEVVLSRQSSEKLCGPVSRQRHFFVPSCLGEVVIVSPALGCYLRVVGNIVP